MECLGIFNKKEVENLNEIIKQLQHENNMLKQEVERKKNNINLLEERISKTVESSIQKDNEIEGLKKNLSQQLANKTILSIEIDEQLSREEIVDSIYQLCEDINTQKTQHIFNSVIIKKKDREAEELKQKEKRVELLILLNQLLFSIRPINSLMDLLHLSSQENEIITVRDLKEKILNIRVGKMNLINDHILDYNRRKLKYRGLHIYPNTTGDLTTFAFYQKVFKGINNFEDALMAYCINTPKEKAILYKERLIRFYKLTPGSSTDGKLEKLDNLIRNKYIELQNDNYLVLKDVSPKRGYEGIDEYIFRILKGTSDYDQAIRIFANCTVHQSIGNFRLCLIAKGIIPEDFNKNTLYDDIEKVKK